MIKRFTKSKNNQSFRDLWISILIIAAFTVSFVFDDPITKKLGIAFTLETASIAVFSAVATISAIWTACYLLFYQLYKDRYPLQLVQNDNQFKMKMLFASILLSLIMGMIMLLKSDYVIPTIFYLLFSAYTIVFIFIEVYRVNKSLMVNTYVDAYCQKIRKQIEKNTDLPSKKAWKEVAYIFDESITKEEYLVAQNITDNLGEVFREFLKDSIAIIGNGNNESQANELFSQIVDYNISQISNCKNVKSDMLIQHVATQNYKNIEFCINSNQYEWFKQYISKLNSRIYILLEDNQESLLDAVAPIYNRILGLLIKQGKEEWWEYLVNQFHAMIRDFHFISGNYNLKYFISLLTTGFICCIKEENDYAFKFFIKILDEFTHSINRIPRAFTDIKVYYAIIFNKVYSDKPSEIQAISDIIFAKDISMPEDGYWLEFKFYCITELKKLDKQADITQRIEEYHIQTILDAIDFRDKYQGVILIPDFDKRIKENISSADKIDDIINGLKRILNRCLIKDNISAFYAFLDKINDCFNVTDQANKLAQEKLFELYLWLIQKSSSLVNQQFLELTFDQIRETIEGLDNRRAISTSFSSTIIRGLASAVHSGEKNNIKVVNEIVALLFGFLAEDSALNFMLSSATNKKQLYRSLFNIGTYCIEENYEDGLRRVSNSLGWLAIYSIRQNTGDLTTYILGRAKELYEIASEMDVSPKTMTFLLTLFTTIGTYCCKDRALGKYLRFIIDSIKDADIQSVKTAVRLRTSENETWNDLYENRTKELTTMFLKAFSTQVKKAF